MQIGSSGSCFSALHGRRVCGQGWSLGFCAVFLVLTWVATGCGSRPAATLLTTSPDAGLCLALPAGTCLLRVSEAAVVERPFERRTGAPGDGGATVVLPERGGAGNHQGRVELPFRVDQTRAYAVWLRARWENQCGNSVMLDMDESRGHAVGEDDVYGTWHWVRAGRYTLTTGVHRAVLGGREDGVALDALLVTPDPTYVPITQLRAGQSTRDLRRSADNFDRSPGHGLEPWQAVSGRWDIAFTLDPNRIPDQYALAGRPDTNGAMALAVLQADAWKGVRLAFSLSPQEAGESGAVLERRADGIGRALSVIVLVSNGCARLRVDRLDGSAMLCDLGERVRVHQWHRVVIERWAWVLRVNIDGTPVFTTCALPAAVAGDVGLCVRSGVAVFDDVLVEELPWQAEDGHAQRIPWVVAPGARWERLDGASGGGLRGRRGRVLTGLDRLPLQAVMVDDAPGADSCQVSGAAFTEVWRASGTRLLEVDREKGSTNAVLGMAPGCSPALIRRLAVAYGAPAPDACVEGPYHFTSDTMDDLSDYLDFTPAEQRQTVDPDQAGKLRREKKTFGLVGREVDGTVWSVEAGRWHVADGALVTRTPGCVRYWRDIGTDLDLRARVNLSQPASSAWVELYGGVGAAVRVMLGCSGDAATPAATNGLTLRVPSDGQWHDLRMRVEEDRWEGVIDDGEVVHAPLVRGTGGAIRLGCAAGQAKFDDIRFDVPRARPGAYFYAFDRRETDWWREGGAWIDHGGISCALASQWISLVATNGRGVLWNKRTFSTNLVVAVTVEENTEWFGWQSDPSHVHHAYDTVSLCLSSGRGWDEGYRLEVNSQGHTRTVLYRRGVPVASVLQDAGFPMRYVGGHQPFEPRRNRMALVRAGASLRAFVNGVEVLGFVDPAPLPAGHVGVGGHDTRANFSRIEIRELP